MKNNKSYRLFLQAMLAFSLLPVNMAHAEESEPVETAIPQETAETIAAEETAIPELIVADAEESDEEKPKLSVEEVNNEETVEEQLPEETEEPTPVELVQALLNALPDEITDEKTVIAQMEEIDEAMDALTSEELAMLDLSRYENLLRAFNSEPTETLEDPARDPQEFPFDAYLESLDVVISDANGDHTVNYKDGDSTDINLGEIQRDATLSIKLAFNPNKAAGNEDGSSNPIIYGDTFTCTIPDILSNANGGKWTGRLQDSTTNYGQKNGSIGDFTIENGKLTIKFDQGYIGETGGNIMNAKLNFNGNFDAYGWDEESFEKKLFFGNLPVNVKFPAATVLRNLSIEKTPVNYGPSEFSSSYYGSQGKYALNNTANVDADGYITYKIKVTAAEDNTTFLDNVTISDIFNTDNVDPSSIVLLSAVKGAKDTNIMDNVVTNTDGNGNITGWNVGRLNRGEEATVTFKIKIDKDKITAAVDAAKLANPDTDAANARLIKNTATGTADKLANPVTDDAETKVQNWVKVYKNKSGNYDPETGRQKFIITISAPADNKYTEHNVYFHDYINNNTSWFKASGILDLTIKHADGTETTSTDDHPLYNNYTQDSKTSWTAYLNELKPGDVATFTTYVDFDLDKWMTESGNSSGSNGLTSSSYNYMQAGKGDLKESSDYISFSATKNWVSKSGNYQAADGTIQWTMTGNNYSSALPDANIAGMTVTDTIGANQTMNEEEVLVTFYEPNSSTVRPYTGENAKDGKLAVPTTSTGFTFVVPEGYGDCKYSVTYKTKVTNNYGPSKTYSNTGKVGIWTYTASTTRPRIASIEKAYVERGADWAKWGINILGPVKNGDVLKDSITNSVDTMWMDAGDLDGLTITFNGKTVDKSLYNVVPTTTSNAEKNSGFTVTFLGAITDTDESGREITPTSQNPAKISYKTHTAFPTYQTQLQYGNTATLTVDGEQVDSVNNFFYRSTNPEISKKYKNTVGSDITWTVSVNKNGYGCYKIDENKNPIFYENNGAGQKGGYYAIVTETIPKGLKYSTAKYGNNKGYYAGVPTIEKLSETTNEDGSTTVKLLIGNLYHYEATPNSTSSLYNAWGYYYVDIDIVTQIVDEDCLLDTTNKNFEWKNTAALVSMDGQPYSADATMNIAHTALSKTMKYDGSTAPAAIFTIDMNPEEYDLDPDSETIKIFDESSSTLVIDTSSIKVVDTRDNSPVDFMLDAGAMSASNTFCIEVPDNKPLKITYSAGVSGVTGDEVEVSNNAYFEGRKIEQSTSHFSETVTVLNADAQAQSAIMIWLRKMDTAGNILPDCIFKLEKYTAADGWSIENDNIVTAEAADYATKVTGLKKDILYRLTETKAAENYILDATPQYFCIKLSQDSVVELPDGFTENVNYCNVASLMNAYNAPYVPVTFRKNKENDEFLPGASFKVTPNTENAENAIKDKNGNDVSFTMRAPTEGEELADVLPTFYIAPGTYKLVETTPPAGYLPAAAITFTVNADKTVSVNNRRVDDNTVICTDTPTEITIRKLNGSVSPSVALSGAKLQVLDGTTVKDEWTTDGTDHTITAQLSVGTEYILHEASAPEGYLLADDISFKIKDDGTIDCAAVLDENGAIVMVDKKPSLDIIKVNKNQHTDVAEGAPLAGVSLTMSQGDDEIRTWTTAVTTEDPVTAVAEHFDNLEAGKTYTITENSAPAGYVVIDPFKITPNTDGTFTVTGEDATYADGTLTIKNEYVPTPVDVELTVHKAITGAPVSDKEFTFELKDGDNTETITITGAGDGSFAKKTFTEAGTYTYTIAEVVGTDKGYTYATDSHTVVITVDDDGKGTLSKTVTVDGAETEEVTITNTYNPLETSLSIPVNKMMSEDSDERPSVEDFSFTIEGVRGSEPLPDVARITANEETSGLFDTITFTEVGTYEYTITEVNDQKPGYTYADPINITIEVEDFDGQLGAAMLVDGEESRALTFTNTYKPTPCDAVVNVEKKIEGDKFPEDTEFRFELKPEGDAPIVEEAIVTVTGEGSASWNITFEKAGTYTYTMKEVDDSVSNFTYDSSVKKATFTVVDEAAELKATCSIDGKDTDTAVFTNTYKAPKKPTAPRVPDTSDPTDIIRYGLIAVVALIAAIISTRMLKKS